MKLNLTNDNFIFGIISNIITSLFYIMKAESRKPLSNYNTKKQNIFNYIIIINFRFGSL